jgi:hypothetical protein
VLLLSQASSTVATAATTAKKQYFVTHAITRRAANLPILQHGTEAELEVARLAGLMLDRGDDEGAGVATD